LTAARETLNVMKDGTLALALYRSGDSGTLSFIGGGSTGYVAAYKFGLIGGLATRDSTFGEVSWSKISADQSLKNGMDNIIN
jgi:hypothetical protein